MNNIMIKNVPHEKILNLSEEVNINSGQIVSKTLAQNNAISITLFAFGQGEEISTHNSKGDAMITILEGSMKIIIDNQEHILNTGDTIIMPSIKNHSVHSITDSKMILTVVFPTD